MGQHITKKSSEGTNLSDFIQKLLQLFHMKAYYVMRWTYRNMNQTKKLHKEIVWFPDSSLLKAV